MRAFPVGILLLVTMAGCFGGSSTDLEVATPALPLPSNLATDGAQDPAATAPDGGPPAWRVGDWWKYKFTSRRPGVENAEYTLVVAGETTDAFLLGLASDAAANQTFFTHMPSLGPVRKTDYAVYRHSHHVAWVPWPLEDGKTWTVEVRGLWTATAKRIEAKVGDRAMDAWSIEYSSNGKLEHRIEWAAAANWWVREEAYLGEDEPVYRLELDAWGRGWTGTARYYAPADLIPPGVRTHSVSQASPGPAGAQSFVTRAGEGDWVLVDYFQWGADAGASEIYGACGVALQPPGGGPVYSFDFCAAGSRVSHFSIPWRDGTWQLAWHLATLEQSLFLEATGVKAATIIVESVQASR